MPHAESPTSSPPLAEASSPAEQDEQAHHSHENEIDATDGNGEGTKLAPTVDDMFDDNDEDEYTSSGIQAPLYVCETYVKQ